MTNRKSMLSSSNGCVLRNIVDIGICSCNIITLGTLFGWDVCAGAHDTRLPKVEQLVENNVL